MAAYISASNASALKYIAVLVSFVIALVPIADATSSIFSAQISHSGPNFESEAADSFITNLFSPRSKRNYDYNNRLKYSVPISRTTAAFLEAEHNKYRRMVPATNMEYMYWDDNLARSAQRHADRCDFLHSRDRPRNTGENIWAAPFSNYQNAVFLWYDERNHCPCGDLYSHCCGHFTQVVWANSNRFGCAFATCDYVANVPYGWHRYSLVCQYSPAGNRPGVPAYRPQYTGMYACSECPSHAPNCYKGLCIPRRQ